MVRCLTSALVAIGQGKLPESTIAERLESLSRDHLPSPAPADGLAWSPSATTKRKKRLGRLPRMTTQPLTSGFDPTDFSTKTRPQDDLFQYVNGNWIERTPLPEDKARYGTFDILADGAELAIREILEESRTASEGSEARKVGDLYSSFLDEERVNQLGAGPLVDRLALVDAVSTVNELLSLIGRLQRRGIGGFFAVFVNNDPGDPERYVTMFEQGGLSLPDESYYREEHFASIRDAFVVHVERMLELAGKSDAATRAKRIFELEIQDRRRSLEQRGLARQREDLQPE